MNGDESLNKRREQRYEACDDERLQTETFIEFNDPIEGTVIDISNHGLRLLCSGSFVVGQPFVTELKTDRLHGVYPGIIRRVVPWVEGKSVLGCELFEEIPDDVLERLAREEAINRRRDDRVDWKQSAKMSWELQPGDVNIEIQDFSLSGLKIGSRSAIPDNVRVRIRIELGDGEQMIVDAKTAWQNEHEDGCSVGLAFTKPEIPEYITRIVADGGTDYEVQRTLPRKSSMRPAILIAATMVACGAAVWHAGL